MHALILLAHAVVILNAVHTASTTHRKESNVFESESTDFDGEVAKLVELLQLKPGMTYCEMGGGDGQFMVALGKAVKPGGHVIVTEGFEITVQALKTQAENAHIDVSTVLATDARMGLPADACDAIFSRMVYHMIDEKVAVETYLPQLSQALKPGGQMLIIDHDPDNGGKTRADASITFRMPNMHDEHSEMHHKMPVVPRQQEIEEFTSAGLALTKTLEWPWLGEAGHGYALLWKHGMSSSQKSQPTLESNVESQPIQVRRQTSKQGRKVSQSVDSTGKIADSTGKIARHES